MNTPLLKRNRTVSSQDSTTAREEDEHYGTYYRYPSSLQPGHFSSLEKLMFFVSSVLLILLFVFVGLYARSSTGHEPSIFPPPKHHNSTKQAVCLEPSCIKAAATVLQDVDTALSPCQDFYAYTCSKWIDSHMIPATQPFVNLPMMTTQSIRYRLHQLLLQSKAHTEGLPDPDEILDRQLFGKLTDIYRSCLRDPAPRDVRVLYPIFLEIQRHVPLTGHTQEGLNAAVRYLAERGVWSLFEIRTEPDRLEDLVQPAVRVLPPPQVTADREAYVRMVSAVLEVVFAQDREFGWRSWSALATARRIVEFESEWVMKSDKVERWATAKMLKEVSEVDWDSYAHGKPVYVERELLNKIKRNSSVNGRTLQMYLVWRTIWTYIDTLGEEFTKQKRRLNAERLGMDPQARPERWETCLSILDGDVYLGPLLGRYFVLDHVFEPAINQVDIQVKKIVSRLEERMRRTRQKNGMIEKLREMQFEIGYATHASLNILSVLSLAEYYGELQIDSDSTFFDNLLNVRIQARIQARRELGENQVRPPVFNPTSTQVEYRYEYNQVIIPAGVLQFPYFDVQDPDYLYQGTLGWMIGQAVMHGFDQIGEKYNKKDSVSDWWKDEPSRNCLISQYEAFGLDGDQIVDSSFADNGALMVYDTIANTTIPGLSHWTREQLFYIQFARMKCSKATKKYELINKNMSPDRYRVNVPLMNSKHFSNTFNCKLGSFMNPEHKCQVW